MSVLTPAAYRSIRGFFFVQSNCSAFTASMLRPLSSYFDYTHEYASGNCPLSSDALCNGSYPIRPGNGSTRGHHNSTHDQPDDVWVTSPSPGYNPSSGGGQVRAGPPPALHLPDNFRHVSPVGVLRARLQAR